MVRGTWHSDHSTLLQTGNGTRKVPQHLPDMCHAQHTSDAKHAALYRLVLAIYYRLFGGRAARLFGRLSALGSRLLSCCCSAGVSLPRLLSPRAALAEWQAPNGMLVGGG